MNENKQIEDAQALDEAIDHAFDVALQNTGSICGDEHRQLGKWLVELRTLRAERDLKKAEQQACTGHLAHSEYVLCPVHDHRKSNP